jgi:hypothetical protein
MPRNERREKVRQEFWPAEEAVWAEDLKKEAGWFAAPRTLPLILELLKSKAISGKHDPTRVYLELLARQIDSGVVEMVHEAEHAYHAGYTSPRNKRTWRDGIRLLERVGFIKTHEVNGHYKYVLIVHPTVVIARLREQGRIPDEWWNMYRDRQIETKEQGYEQRVAKRPGVVVNIRDAKPSSPRLPNKKRVSK